MDKLYHRIGFENSPSKKTPLNEMNLNKMDKALDDLDNRIIEQDVAFAKSIEEEDKKIEEVKGMVNGLTDTAASLIQSKADAITVEKSGTTIVATDSSDKGFEQFKTFGKSEQEKTSGNQLFDGKEYLVEGSADGIKASTLGSAIIPIVGGKSYTVSIRNADMIYTCSTSDFPTVGTAIIDAYSGSSGLNVNNKTVNTSANAKYLVIRFGSALANHKDSLMVNEGTTPLPWEEYTGGQASPNPEYPQPIVSAGQKMVEGNQLFDIDSLSMLGTEYGFSTPRKGFALDINGTVTFSQKSTSKIIVYRCYNKNTKALETSAEVGSGFTKTVAEHEVLIMHSDSSGDWSTVVDGMLNYGTTALPYEPYTGGVKKAVDVGIQYKVTGENLINQACTPVGSALDKKHFLKAGTYTVSRDVSENGNNWYLGMWDTNGNCITKTATQLSGWNLTGSGEYYYGGGNSKDVVFELKVDCFVGFYTLNGSGKTYLMLNEGTVALPYEPYTEQTLTINKVLRGIEVTDPSLANYTDENGQMWCADYGDVERKVWVQRIGVSVLNGVGNYLTNGPANTYCVNVDDMMKLKDYTGMILCDQYLCNAKSNTYAVDKCVTGYHDSKNTYPTQNWVYIRDSSYANVTELVNALKAKPITVYYPLVTPIETPMTEDEIAAYNALHTNKPNTIITNDAGCFMEVEYVADTKTHMAQNYVPVSKYTALEDRVSALERLHV